MTRWALGPEEDPRWARPALWALLAVTAVVYLWDLTNSGYANEFYAAAVKSGTKDWTAWFFGSLDSANSITVDKPPAALWVMGLSARIFGFSSFSLLLPQALMGIGTVALTYGAVRRWAGHGAGLFAGALVTATPVAALMFRFDNPDAMLVLLMSAAAYTVVRAVDADTARKAGRWILAAGLLVGFAFLAKMLQGLLVLPGMGLAYLVAARHSLKTRLIHLVEGLVGVVVGAGWFVAVAQIWPASARPYIGGSTNNSVWELALGYNGLGRLFGGSGNGGGGGGGGQNAGFGGTPGLLRMFNSAFGTEISWFLPAALILLVAGLVARGSAPRTDRGRAGLVLFGSWMLVTAICLSFMQGTVHGYYVIALAPGIAGTIAFGARETLARGSSLAWRCVTAAAVCVTAIWSFRLLSTTASSWMPWLRWLTVIIAVLGAMVYVAASAWPQQGVRRAATTGLIVGTLASAGGSAAWTLATIGSGHNGSTPTSGPAVAGGQQGGMGGGQAGGPGSAGKASGTSQAGAQGAAQKSGGTKPSGKAGGTKPSGNPGMMPAGGAGGSKTGGTAQQGTAPTSGSTTGSKSSTSSTGSSSGQANGSAPGGGSSSNAALTALLKSSGTTWSAAVVGDQTAAGYILSSDTAVMSIGGWSGTDNNVTLAQFQQYVASGKIHYFIAGGGMGGGPGGNSGSGSAITAWVKAHYTAKTVGGVTVYDLTQAKS